MPNLSYNYTYYLLILVSPEPYYSFICIADILGEGLCQDVRLSDRPALPALPPRVPRAAGHVQEVPGGEVSAAGCGAGEAPGLQSSPVTDASSV